MSKTDAERAVTVFFRDGWKPVARVEMPRSSISRILRRATQQEKKTAAQYYSTDLPTMRGDYRVDNYYVVRDDGDVVIAEKFEKLNHMDAYRVGCELVPSIEVDGAREPKPMPTQMRHELTNAITATEIVQAYDRLVLRQRAQRREDFQLFLEGKPLQYDDAFPPF